MFVAVSKITGEAVGPFDDLDAFQSWFEVVSANLDDDDLAGYRPVWDVREVRFTADPHDFAPEDGRVTFGPGRLEDIALLIWADGTVKVEGQYRVYCGMGNEHPFSIDSGFIAKDDYAKILANHTERFPRVEKDAVYSAVAEIVDEVLGEEWFDPCDDPDAED